MSECDRYRLSFERIAEAYERSRPQYAPEAVAWVAERLPFRRVLDLAAGTGKLTRQLVPLAESVVAVEPGDELRAVLEHVLPGVEALAGSAEAIPLPDASVDAVTVGQAFHWFESEAALAEMHRVLRPGGGIALLWNQWDVEDPVLRAVDAVVDRLRRVRTDDDDHENLLATPFFANFEEPRFRHSDTLDADTAVERVASVSAIVAATAEERAAALDEVRRILGEGAVEFSMITTVIAADRV